MVAEHRRPDCSHVFVFDGCPLTVAHAQWLGELLKQHVFNPPLVLQSCDRASYAFAPLTVGEPAKWRRHLYVSTARQSATALRS